MIKLRTLRNRLRRPRNAFQRSALAARDFLRRQQFNKTRGGSGPQPVTRYFNELDSINRGYYDVTPQFVASSFRFKHEVVFRGAQLVMHGRGGNQTSTAIINADGSIYWGFDNNTINNVTTAAGLLTDDDTLHNIELVRNVIGSDSQISISIDGIVVLSQLVVGSTTPIAARYLGRSMGSVYSDGILCCTVFEDFDDPADKSTFELDQDTGIVQQDLEGNRTITSINPYDHREYAFDADNNYWDDGAGKIIYLPTGATLSSWHDPDSWNDTDAWID